MGFDRDPGDIGREIDGKPPREFRDQRPGPKKKPRRVVTTPAKSTLPTASPEASECAEAWMREAEARGLSQPFNVNWLALQISDRVARDKEISHRLEITKWDGRDDVRRWVLKMVQQFWRDVYEDSMPSKDLSWEFLEYWWDALRYEAFKNLRAAYLNKHGVPRKPPEPVDHRTDEGFLERQRLRIQEMIDTPVRPPVKRLDERQREVLRSIRERSRERRSK